ncbi:MAG: hypothetical protein H6705_12840, partial [Myxococcales bacterium]|nr:hypothetical protein [Myxococcales bacterium]
FADLLEEGAIDKVQVHYRPSAYTALALLDLRHDRQGAFEHHFARVSTSHTGFIHPIARRMLDEIAGLLEARGELTTAARAWQISADYWRPVDPARADTARARGEALLQRGATPSP